MMANARTRTGTDAAEAEPTIRRIGLADLRAVLAEGWQDFKAIPTQLVFLCVLYPVLGFVAARAAYGGNLMPLIWPLVSGFALVGPVAALGIYELSRRREQGLPTSWVNVFDVLRSPSIVSIVFLGGILLAIFVCWLLAAQAIWGATVGADPPASIGELVRLTFGTSEGWTLLWLGNLVGFLFAVVVLSLTVMAFPMLLDRAVDPAVAMRTSVRAVLANPVPMAAWGLIVGVLLLVGMVPLFIGLAVVLPVLGHSTWHLYRRVVVR